jgi:hypothetical protein
MSEVFSGTVEVTGDAAGTAIVLDGSNGDVVVSRQNGTGVRPHSF